MGCTLFCGACMQAFLRSAERSSCPAISGLLSWSLCIGEACLAKTGMFADVGPVCGPPLFIPRAKLASALYRLPGIGFCPDRLLRIGGFDTRLEGAQSPLLDRR